MDRGFRGTKNLCLQISRHENKILPWILRLFKSFRIFCNHKWPCSYKPYFLNQIRFGEWSLLHLWLTFNIQSFVESFALVKKWHWLVITAWLTSFWPKYHSICSFSTLKKVQLVDVYIFDTSKNSFMTEWQN